ncbi:LrgB family protein [Erysipelotrichaceae bacterium HCN-30851]
MNELWNTPMFGILLSLAAFEIGLWIQKKTKLLFLNPLLISIIIVMAVLFLSETELSSYQQGGDIISLFLGPATVVLAVPLYQQVQSLKNYFAPIMVGILCGILVGLSSTLLCSWLLNIHPDMIASLLPKSITTPIGMELSNQLGGIQAVTVFAILVTGIMGAIVAEIVFRFFRIHHPIAKGIALGCSSHAIGTTKALQLGHIEGAMSSLAIGVCGILTVFIAPVVWNLIIAFL